MPKMPSLLTNMLIYPRHNIQDMDALLVLPPVIGGIAALVFLAIRKIDREIRQGVEAAREAHRGKDSYIALPWDKEEWSSR